MTEDGKLHDEAEDIRNETAEEAPELAEHDRFAELERQLEEANVKALYAAAEAQNVRRRLETGQQQATSYAAANFARDMLAIKDHLDRALVAVSDELRQDKVASQFLAGIEATSRELESVFTRHGSRRIQASASSSIRIVTRRWSSCRATDVEPGTIIEEMQPGYMMKDRLLSPALVGVAKKPD